LLLARLPKAHNQAEEQSGILAAEVFREQGA
jgi:hypothetical protein